MQKDVTQKQLEDWNDVFADIYNGIAFGGKKILQEENLISLPTESFTKNMDGTVQQGFRDVRKADQRQGEYRLIWSLENQTGVDNTMPERIMGYEYASYEAQVKKLMAQNRKEKKRAYTRRLHDHQKLAPVVTAVLHWGEKEWNGPRCLHDMLDFPEELEEELRPMVSDYSFHLIEMSKLPQEVRERFRSDFRILAEYAATRKNPKEWEAFLQTYQRKLLHPEELMNALEALSGDSRYEQAYEKITEEEKEEGVKMCVVAEKLEQIGIQKGIQQNTLRTVCNMLKRNKPESEIFELTECSRELFEEAKRQMEETD